MQSDENVLQEIMKIIDQADTYLAAGEEIAKIAKPVIIKALKVLVNMGIDICKEMKEEMAELSKIKAQVLYRDYNNYVDAGFGKTEAFKLVLVSIKPIDFSEVLSKVSSQNQSCGKKNCRKDLSI